MQFSELKLNKQLLNAVAELGYEETTPIQEKGIPLALAGHDVIGIAQTGTGKTAAYILPLLMKIKYAQGKDPRGLVLAPTRELSMQIAANAVELSRYTDLRIVVIYGGKGIKAQIAQIEEGVDILIATPQRLIDVYRAGGVNLRSINTMILDEADRMMDMGFMPQIRKLLEYVPHKKRQNLLFSATMPPKVLELSTEFLDFPQTVEITPQATAAETVTQCAYAVPNFRTKLFLLHHLLEDDTDFEKILIFTRTKDNANEIYNLLRKKYKDEIKVIHANKDQNARMNAMEAFRSDEIRILVATDVVARGLDVSMITHVINFDVPRQYEDYVHRIGRTGRAKQTGKAITFFNEVEAYHIRQIEKLIRTDIPKEEIPEEVKVWDTPFLEKQAIARELDTIRKRNDPSFKGAFHEKKKRPHQTAKKQYSSKKGGKRRR